MTNTAPAPLDLSPAAALLAVLECRMYAARAAHCDAVTAQDRAEGGDPTVLAIAHRDVARTAGRYVEARAALRIAKSYLA